MAECAKECVGSSNSKRATSCTFSKLYGIFEIIVSLGQLVNFDVP